MEKQHSTEELRSRVGRLETERGVMIHEKDEARKRMSTEFEGLFIRNRICFLHVGLCTFRICPPCFSDFPSPFLAFTDSDLELNIFYKNLMENRRRVNEELEDLRRKCVPNHPMSFQIVSLSSPDIHSVIFCFSTKIGATAGEIRRTRRTSTQSTPRSGEVRGSPAEP